MSTNCKDMPPSSAGATAPSANPTPSASQSANPTSSIFSVVEAILSSSHKSRSKLNLKKPLLRQSRESQTYVVVSHDRYVLRCHTKDPTPTKLYDFRCSNRFDLLRGSCSVTRRADGDACKLCLTYPEHSRPSNRNCDVLTLLFVNEAHMNVFAGLVEDGVASLEKLRVAVDAKRFRLNAGGEDSESQYEILMHLRGRTTSSLTVEQQDDADGGDTAVFLTDKLDSLKDALDVYTGVAEWVKAVVEAVASGKDLAAPWLPVFATLPFVGPVAQLVSVVGDVTRLEVDRSKMKEEMKKLHQECGEVAKRVLLLLSSSLDMKVVDDDVVNDLFEKIGCSVDVGQLAEQLIMSGWYSQRAAVEKVRGLTDKMSMARQNIRHIHIQADTKTIREGQKNIRKVQEGMREGQNMILQRLDQQSRPKVATPFKRNDQIPDLPVFESMKWAEGSGAPEAELRMELLSDENSSRGLVGVIGMSGVGKSTMLNCVVHQQEVKDLYTGGIYSLDIGKGCDQRKVITEIARAVRASGVFDESEKITKKETVREAVNVAKPWFAGHRCLFVLDDLCTTKNSKTGFVHNVREVADVHSSSRVLFSSRYEALGEVAVACDYVNVKEREADAAKGIMCRHAQIDRADIDELQKGARISEKDKKSYDAFCGVLDRCNGFPLSLAVAGKTVARLAKHCQGDASVDRIQYFQKLNTKGLLRRLRSKTVEEDGMEGYGGFLETVRWTWHAFGEMNKAVKGHNISEIRHMHCGLCVFGQQERVPIHVVQKLWEVETEEEAEEIAMWLCGAGLVEIHTPKDAEGMLSISVHDLIQKVCVRIAEEFGMSEEYWHRHLLAKYLTNVDGPREWWRCKGIDDGYMRENLRRHLIAGGLWKELRDLLLEFRWIKNRLQRVKEKARDQNALQEEILSVLRDYEALTNDMNEFDSRGSNKRGQGDERDTSFSDDVNLIADALRLSAEKLRSDPGQVASQLHGRLFAPECSATVQKFLESLETHQDQPWIRTIRHCMPMATQALRKQFVIPILSSETRYENWDCKTVQARYIPNSREILLTSGDGTTNVVVDLESERVTRRLVCIRHQNQSDDEEPLTCPLSCSTVSRDGRYVIAGHAGSVHAWDLSNCGYENHSEVFGGCKSMVTALDITPDSQYVIIGCLDGTLRVWDFCNKLSKCGDENHSEVFGGGESMVTALDIMPDSKYFIIGCLDGTLRVWDICNRKIVSDEKACPGHPVESVFVSPSGGLIVSLSWNWGRFHTMLHVWKLTEDGVLMQQSKAVLEHGSLISEAALAEEEGSRQTVLSGDKEASPKTGATFEEEDGAQVESSDGEELQSTENGVEKDSLPENLSWEYKNS